MKKFVCMQDIVAIVKLSKALKGKFVFVKIFASKNDFVIVKEYIDRAMTGTNDKRPAFQQMLLDSKKT